MQFTIITLFPHIFDSVFSYSIINRAQKEKIIKINILDLREFGIGDHKTVDDKPYGGGVGMVLRVDVLDNAINAARIKNKKEAVILLDPKGQVFKQKLAEQFTEYEHLIMICGHYEGYDERIRKMVDFEVSLGDFILSGGEIGGMAIVEAVTRLIKGVIKKEDGPKLESFSKIDNKRILETPHYTRPSVYKGEGIPDVLLSGNFKEIEEWRKESAKKVTKKTAPISPNITAD